MAPGETPTPTPTPTRVFSGIGENSESRKEAQANGPAHAGDLLLELFGGPLLLRQVQRGDGRRIRAGHWSSAALKGCPTAD